MESLREHVLSRVSHEDPTLCDAVVMLLVILSPILIPSAIFLFLYVIGSILTVVECFLTA